MEGLKTCREVGINPHQKKIPVKYEGKAYTEFRKEVYAAHGPFCHDCGDNIQFTETGQDKWGQEIQVFNVFTCAHVAHMERRAKIGDDIDKCRIKCYSCHILREHWGENG